MLWVHYCRAVLSPTSVCTVFPRTFFFSFNIHVLLMQNYKTGACECEYIFWSEIRMCVWIQMSSLQWRLDIHLLYSLSWLCTGDFCRLYSVVSGYQLAWAGKHTGLIGVFSFLSFFFFSPLLFSDRKLKCGFIFILFHFTLPSITSFVFVWNDLAFPRRHSNCTYQGPNICRFR